MINNADTRRYKHVIIVGIDGMGIICKNTPTPRMDDIFKDGASSTKALSLFPTISAQNWGAMLLGTEPEVHGLTNGKVSQFEYKNEELPSIFTSVRKAYPDSVLCSISNWEPINTGIIEHNIGVNFDTADNGASTTDKVVDCILTEKPDLLFIHIDDPDEAGHHFGKLKYIREGDRIRFTDMMGMTYVYKVSKVDLINEENIDIMKENNGWDLTLFTCTYGARQRITLRCVRTDVNQSLTD